MIPGHSPVTTPKDFDQYQKFTADFVSAVQGALMAGKSAEEATKSIDLASKYSGYKSDRYAAAVTALYAEIKK